MIGYVTHMKDDFVMWLVGELKDRGWPQAEFARRADVSAATVSRVLSGENRPGDDFITGTARAFGLPVERVMRMVGKLPDRGEILPEVGAWSMRLRALTPDQREAAVAAMEAALRAAEAGDRARKAR